LRGERLDVGLLGPGTVRVARAVEQVEDRVSRARRGVVRGQQDANGAVGDDEARRHRNGDVEAAWRVADRARPRCAEERGEDSNENDATPRTRLFHVTS